MTTTADRTHASRRGPDRHRACCRRIEDCDHTARTAATGRSTIPDALLEEVDQSGLLGRGGAAFPLAVKLRTVRDAGRRGGETVVVANGEEGEPASVKDRWLLRNRPHLVLDGLRLAARIVGAHRAHVYVSDPPRPTAVERALAELGADVLGELASACVTVEPGYVAGEETAAVRPSTAGRPSRPTNHRGRSKRASPACRHWSAMSRRLPICRSSTARRRGVPLVGTPSHRGRSWRR